MPTEASWTDAARSDGGWADAGWTDAGWLEAARDVRHLMRFRIGTVRRPRTLALSAAALVAVTVAAAALPVLTGAGDQQNPYALDALTLIPTAMAGFVLTSTVAAVASGGGRELLARDEAAIHPLSGTVDHLGSLLLAPLNLIWLIQAWTLLAAIAFSVPSAQVLPAQIGIALWLMLGTALGQLVAWTVEALRRSRRGSWGVRVGVVVALVFFTWLHVTHELTALTHHLPTRWLLAGLVDGTGWSWVLRVGIEVVVLIGVVWLGAIPAGLAVRRIPPDELRVDSGVHAGRTLPRTDFGLLVRLDRASVWRAVPVRRGVAVLAVGPALAAIFGQLTWTQLPILPALIAAGAALLFGVNVWCLDARGALWRESLPVSPRVVWSARTWVLAEFLLLTSGAGLLPAWRAGVPTLAEVVAVLCSWVSIAALVLASCLRWSAQRPAPVDLRSPRATPAPPFAMVTYSAKLAVGAAVTSLVFSLLAEHNPLVSVLAAFLVVTVAGLRLHRVRAAWDDPVSRARVITTVAA